MTKDPQVAELSGRARRLIGAGLGGYEHPKFFAHNNDEWLYIGLNDKAGGQPVSVYWERNQVLPAGAKGFHVNMEWVTETLGWMRKVMVLDDLADA